MTDEGLVLACIEPTSLQTRGKDETVRLQVRSHLTNGQLALWMFRVLYPAANKSVTGYASWISYLLEQPNDWSGVTCGLRFFGETTMLQLLEGTKEFLEARNPELNLEDEKEILACMNIFFENFQKLLRIV